MSSVEDELEGTFRYPIDPEEKTKSRLLNTVARSSS